jgi:glycosyltransferase involved in cell wall biosynthesis
VATRVGSEGLGAVDAVHLRVADEPEDFAAAVVGLLQSPGLREQLAKQALALVSERFSWSRKVDQLMLELQGLVREHAALGALRSAGRAA